MAAPRDDDLIGTIEAIHAAGLDAKLWPQALAAITHTVGGVGATLEVLDRQSFAHSEFHAFGVAPAEQLFYVEQYAALSPRIPPALRQRPGELTWDYLVLDELGMDHCPFYAEFLASQDFRYAVAGILGVAKDNFGVVAVQHSPRHGHVQRSEIALMARLLPHVSQAFDVARRLKSAGAASRSLAHALDHLADGVALLAADGTIVHANESFRAIIRRHDGINLRKNCIEFASPDARARFAAAIAAVCRSHGDDPRATGGADFPVPRSDGAPAYIVSSRVLAKKRDVSSVSEAVAIVFIRDPLNRPIAAARLLRDMFGFTDAEANLAQAIHAGMSLADYARTHAVTLNTVYTHLRRIKDKTGCKRMVELTRKLGDLQVPPPLD
jgi:DNA-binding CsgD family transcriptional regulator/PAS domain-containing protein